MIVVNVTYSVKEDYKNINKEMIKPFSQISEN